MLVRTLVVQPEVGREIHDPYPLGPQLRDRRRRGAVRVGHHRHVRDRAQALRVELLEVERHPVARVEVVQAPPGVGARGHGLQRDPRVLPQQRRCERARKARRAHHAGAGQRLPGEGL